MIREIVKEEDKYKLAPLLCKLTCDLVSELDQKSIYEVVFGHCAYPDFNWMNLGKRMILRFFCEKMKTKLKGRLNEHKYNVKVPGVPDTVMKSIGYEDEEMEFLISCAMMAKPSIFIPKSAKRPI